MSISRTYKVPLDDDGTGGHTRQERDMAQYRVECLGDVREVYIVEASSEEEALANWHTGDLYISETMGVDPMSAQLDE